MDVDTRRGFALIEPFDSGCAVAQDKPFDSGCAVAQDKPFDSGCALAQDTPFDSLRSLRTTRQASRCAFTLIELLVVVAIISLLVSILLPSLKRARALARRAVCLAEQRSVGLTVRLYAADYEGLFAGPGSWESPDGKYEARWWYRFYDGTIGHCYDAALATLCCTENTAGHYGLYQHFGTYWNGCPCLDAGFMHRESWHGGFFYWYDSYAFRAPADFLLVADTSAANGPFPQLPLEHGNPWFCANLFWSGGASGCQGVWLAHPGGAGGLFADGHGEVCDGDRLLDTENARETGDPDSGGIRRWKERDGTLVYN